MNDVQFAMQTVVINANRKFSHQNSGNVSIYSQKRLRKFGRGPGEAKEATLLCVRKKTPPLRCNNKSWRFLNSSMPQTHQTISLWRVTTKKHLNDAFHLYEQLILTQKLIKCRNVALPMSLGSVRQCRSAVCATSGRMNFEFKTESFQSFCSEKSRSART